MRTIFILIFVLNFVSKANSQDQIGDWNVDISRDPMTDAARTIIIYTGGVEGSPTRDLGLGFTCRTENEMQVVAALTHKYLGGDSDNNIRFTYRLDASPAVEVGRVHMGSSSKATFPFGVLGSGSDEFVSGLLISERLVLRVVDPLDGETLTQTLRVGRLRDALVAGGCQVP